MHKGRPEEWTALIENARNLENLADRAYVMQIVALCLPNNMSAQRGRLLAEARAAIEQIPSELDRFEHYLCLAEDLQDGDRSQCRELVNAAASVLAKSSENIRGREQGSEPRKALSETRKNHEWFRGGPPTLASRG